MCTGERKKGSNMALSFPFGSVAYIGFVFARQRCDHELDAPQLLESVVGRRRMEEAGGGGAVWQRTTLAASSYVSVRVRQLKKVSERIEPTVRYAVQLADFQWLQASQLVCKTQHQR